MLLFRLIFPGGRGSVDEVFIKKIMNTLLFDKGAANWLFLSYLYCMHIKKNVMTFNSVKKNKPIHTHYNISCIGIYVKCFIGICQ